MHGAKDDEIEPDATSKRRKETASRRRDVAARKKSLEMRDTARYTRRNCCRPPGESMRNISSSSSRTTERAVRRSLWAPSASDDLPLAKGYSFYGSLDAFHSGFALSAVRAIDSIKPSVLRHGKLLSRLRRFGRLKRYRGKCSSRYGRRSRKKSALDTSRSWGEATRICEGVMELHEEEGIILQDL